MSRLTIEIYVDDQGAVKIANVSKSLEDLGTKGQKAGAQATSAFSQTAGACEQAAAAAGNVSSQLLQVLGVTVSIAGAAYLVEKAISSWYSVITGGIEAVDNYQRQIISASAMLTSMTDTTKEPDLSKAYDEWKDYFAWLWTASIDADKRVAASGTEIFMTAQELAKKGVKATEQEMVDIAGRLTDFIKQVSPMGAAEGGTRSIEQIRSEVREMLAGNVRMGAQVAQMFDQIDANFKENMAKARETGTVYEYLDRLLIGQKYAVKDMANTWESVSSSLKATWQQVNIAAFSEGYADVVKYAQDLLSLLMENGELTARGKNLADALGEAWSTAKPKVEELLTYILDNSPEVITNVQNVAGAVGNIAAAAISAVQKVSELYNRLKDLPNSLPAWIGGGAAAGFMAGGPPGAVAGAIGGLGGGMYYNISRLMDQNAKQQQDLDGALKAGQKASVGVVGRITDITQLSSDQLAALKDNVNGQLRSLGATQQSLENLQKQGKGSGKAPATPPVRPYKPEDAAGAGGGTGAAENRIRSMLSNLDAELMKLSEGSLAGVDGWLNKMLGDIGQVASKGVDGTEAESKAYEVAFQRKKKLTDEFWLLIAKYSGDSYALLEAEYQRDLQKYQGALAQKKMAELEAIKDPKTRYQAEMAAQKEANDAKLALDQAYEVKRQELRLKSSKAIEDLSVNALKAMAQSTPFLGQQLALESQLLDAEIRRGRADQDLQLQKLLNSHEITAAQADDIRGVQAMADQYRRFAQQMKGWQTEGIGGGIKLWQMDVWQREVTEGADYFKSVMQRAGSWITDTLGQGLADVFLGKKIDKKAMQEQLLGTAFKEMMARAWKDTEKLLAGRPPEGLLQGGQQAAQTLEQGGAACGRQIISAAQEAAAVLSRITPGGRLGGEVPAAGGGLGGAGLGGMDRMSRDFTRDLSRDMRTWERSMSRDMTRMTRDFTRTADKAFNDFGGYNKLYGESSKQWFDTGNFWNDNVGDTNLQAGYAGQTAAQRGLMSNVQLGLGAASLGLGALAMITGSRELSMAAMVLQVAATLLMTASELGIIHGGGIVAHEGLLVAHNGFAFDERLAKLQVGEWVIQRDSVAKLVQTWGPGLFNMINEEGRLPIDPHGMLVAHQGMAVGAQGLFPPGSFMWYLLQGNPQLQGYLGSPMPLLTSGFNLDPAKLDFSRLGSGGGGSSDTHYWTINQERHYKHRPSRWDYMRDAELIAEVLERRTGRHF
jgi:hypothetical protein